MFREITPATTTQFPVGSKVKITNPGHCHSMYRDMAQYLGIEDTYKWGKNPFNQGDIGVVVARATHETSSYGEVFAVKVGDKVGMIGYRGLVEHEELKPILFDEMREGQVVRFTKFKGHEYWDFVVGKDYTVECNEYGYTGPRNPNGSIPSCKWGDWEWVLVSEAPQEPTLDEVKAELATVRAKLWEAEQKLNQIKEIL